MLNILLLEIFSIFHSAGFVVCFVFGSLGLFLCLVFGFLVVYSLYTPWGPFCLVLIQLLIYQKKKNERMFQSSGRETIIIKDYPVSFLPDRLEKARKSHLPHVSSIFSNGEGCPCQHQLFNQGRTNPDHS